MGIDKSDEKKTLFSPRYFKDTTEQHGFLGDFLKKHKEKNFVILTDTEYIINQILSLINDSDEIQHTGLNMVHNLFTQMLSWISNKNVIGLVNAMEHSKRPKPKDIDNRWKGKKPLKNKKQVLFTDYTIPTMEEFASMKVTGIMRKQLNRYVGTKMYQSDLFEDFLSKGKFIITDNIVEHGFTDYKSVLKVDGETSYEDASLMMEGEMAIIFWMYALVEKNRKKINRSMNFVSSIEALKKNKDNLNFICNIVDGDMIGMLLLHIEHFEGIDVWIQSTKGTYINIHAMATKIMTMQPITLLDLRTNAVLLFVLIFICPGNDFTKNWCKGISFQKIYAAINEYMDVARLQKDVDIVEKENGVINIGEKVKFDFVDVNYESFIKLTKYIYVYDSETKLQKPDDPKIKMKDIVPKKINGFPSFNGLNSKYKKLRRKHLVKQDQIDMINEERILTGEKLKTAAKPIPSEEEIMVHAANGKWILTYWLNSIKFGNQEKKRIKAEDVDDDGKLTFGYMMDNQTGRLYQATNIYYKNN